MVTVADVLKKHRVGMTEDDVARELDAAFTGLRQPAAAPLTESESAFLVAHAGPGADRIVGEWDANSERELRASAQARALHRVMAGSIDVQAAAGVLGVDRSRISHRLSAGTLYGTKLASKRRIPLWQFWDNEELPGLARVVRAIPAGAHPLDVEGVMSTPQDELGGRTPVEHLHSGGAPMPVEELLRELDRW